MSIIVFILVILAYLSFSGYKERNKLLEKQVDSFGGMANKYKYLIERLTAHPDAKVVKITRDHVHIRAVGNATATNYLITEMLNTVEIEWVGQMGYLGEHKKKWVFPDTYSQPLMVGEIENYMEKKSKEMFGW